MKSASLLVRVKPEFFSVTFGAGGGTTDLTFETALSLKESLHCPVAPHISCRNISKEKVFSILGSYLEAGLERLVVLRGDQPSGSPAASDFPFASDLIELIRRKYGSSFFLDVAAYPEIHPESASPKSEMLNFRKKVQAGADRAITQYFFNCDAYFRFVDDCQKYGIDIPIIAGLMPITDATGLRRFSNNCGAEIPRWISKRMDEYSDNREALEDFGVDVLTQITTRLLEAGAPGIHFFTLNKTDSVLKICANLDLIR
tara:strand:- start:1128 stop:1901 length:774 start_codon:yes stop_codon:yes gene_type:complete